MLEVKIESYNELSDEEKYEVANNGVGKENAAYIRMVYDGETFALESDAMEPEDATFTRDLSWVKHAIEHAHMLGRNDQVKEKP